MLVVFLEDQQAILVREVRQYLLSPWLPQGNEIIFYSFQNKPKSCFPQPRFIIQLFTFLTSLTMLNLTISWQPRPLSVITSPISSDSWVTSQSESLPYSACLPSPSKIVLKAPQKSSGLLAPCSVTFPVGDRMAEVPWENYGFFQYFKQSFTHFLLIWYL